MIIQIDFSDNKPFHAFGMLLPAALINYNNMLLVCLDCLVFLVCLVYLVFLVCLVNFVYLVHFFDFVILVPSSYFLVPTVLPSMLFAPCTMLWVGTTAL